MAERIIYEGCYVVTPRIVRAHTAPWRDYRHCAPTRAPEVPGRLYIEAQNPYSSYISLKKGAQIKSYLISHALITAGFKM